MATTRAGFTVLDPKSDALTTIRVADVPIVCWKPAAKAVKHLATFLTAVEPIREAGWDGGYAHRLVRGSTSVWSEHAGAVAIDWNASQHPLGVAGEPGWTTDQERVIRWYLRTTIGRLWVWGADFRRPDSMHFQLRDRKLWDETAGWWKS